LQAGGHRFDPDKLHQSKTNVPQGRFFFTERGIVMKKRFAKFIGTKAFYKQVLIVAIPLMLQQLVTSSVNLLDNLMVGQLGDASLSGVAVTNRFFMIAIFGTFGVLAASSIYIAQFFGAKDEDHMKQSFRYSILSAYIIMLPFVALGLLFPETILSFFTKTPAILEQGAVYMRIAALTFVPLALTMALGNAMRSIGQTKIPLYAGVVSVLTNAFFNYAMIFGHFGFPAMGVAGAAWATLIARIVELTILLVVMNYKHFPFSTRIHELFKIQKYLVRTITIKALPLTTNEIFWSAGMATLFKFYSTRGDTVLVGFQIAGTTADLFFVLFGGMAAATTVLISQPLGANKLSEARDNGYKLLGFSIFLAMVLAVLMFTSSFFVPYLYRVSEESRWIAMTQLRIMSVMFWIYMGTSECYFILRAGGDTKSTLFMDSVFMWTVNIPVVAAVTYFTKWPVFGLYLVGQSTDFFKMTLAYLLVRREKWVKNLTMVRPLKLETEDLIA
jgi:putative MATE family efflux protein